VLSTPVGCGTCAIGTVVDSRFRVNGCEGLRDAGISNREVVIVTGAKLDLSPGFDGKSAVAIHF